MIPQERPRVPAHEKDLFTGTERCARLEQRAELMALFIVGDKEQKHVASGSLSDARLGVFAIIIGGWFVACVVESPRKPRCENRKAGSLQR